MDETSPEQDISSSDAWTSELFPTVRDELGVSVPDGPGGSAHVEPSDSVPDEPAGLAPDGPGDTEPNAEAPEAETLEAQDVSPPYAPVKVGAPLPAELMAAAGSAAPLEGPEVASDPLAAPQAARHGMSFLSRWRGRREAAAAASVAAAVTSSAAAAPVTASPADVSMEAPKAAKLPWVAAASVPATTTPAVAVDEMFPTAHMPLEAIAASETVTAAPSVSPIEQPSAFPLPETSLDEMFPTSRRPAAAAGVAATAGAVAAASPVSGPARASDESALVPAPQAVPRMVPDGTPLFDSMTPMDVVSPPAPVPHSRQTKRRSLVPAWVWWTLAGIVSLTAVVALLAVLRTQALEVRVPSLQGMQVPAAKARLEELGLTLKVGDKRFSASAPVDTIIDQLPKPGTRIPEGTVVVVALSVGSETFGMPDIVGMSLDDARRKLKDRGLAADVQTVASDRPQGTIIESFPSAGVNVQTGDTVRVSVAAGTGTDSALLPTDLSSRTFVVDPAPSLAGGVDTTMDVARRLRALLEASGAKVIMTRDPSDTSASSTTITRARKAKESSSTALIGLSVTSSGRAGLAVVSMPATTSTESFYIKSISLSSAVTDALKKTFTQVGSESGVNDALLTGTGVPGVRVQLGSSAVTADKLQFTDPQWADNVARAVYTAVGDVYGTR